MGSVAGASSLEGILIAKGLLCFMDRLDGAKGSTPVTTQELLEIYPSNLSGPINLI